MGYFDYGYDYVFEPGAAEAFGSVFGALMGFFLVFYLLMLAFAVAAYVLQSLGLHTVAKRRGIHNPWLSWLPIGNMWILGSISDQYQYVTKGRVRNRRKILMGLTIAMMALLFVMYGGIAGMALGAAGAVDALAGFGIALTLITALALMVISIVAVVYEYIVIYDLYRSCEPDNAVLYLVLSIFFAVALPVFFFVCRKKDLGMPPRKEAPQEIPLVEAVVETPVDITEE